MIKGTTFIYQSPDQVEFNATKENYSIFGEKDVIQLRYPSLTFNDRGIYDILKIIDKDTIIGKAFLGKPPYGIDLFTFCLSRKYPAQFMDLDDHENIFSRILDDTSLVEFDGRWAARDVKYNVLDRRVVVNFEKGESEKSKTDKLKKIIDIVIDERLENVLKKVNDNFYVGKLSGGWHDKIRWDVPDYYIEEKTDAGVTTKRILIRYVLTI